ncbi:aldehyde dehydrogenase family protein [Effusibacillus lacus]|nr:aldehyde dehydrogenase family protein [Effusibacillus lacus]
MNLVAHKLDWIAEAKQNGAKVATGGAAQRNILLPTVLLDVDPAVKVSFQEVFAPIVLINKVKTVDEAIEQVNDSRYGLQAGIYTENVHTAFDAAERLHVGEVMINDISTFRVNQMPYGEVKESGFGREGLKYASEEMTELKLVVFMSSCWTLCQWQRVLFLWKEPLFCPIPLEPSKKD